MYPQLCMQRPSHLQALQPLVSCTNPCLAFPAAPPQDPEARASIASRLPPRAWWQLARAPLNWPYSQAIRLLAEQGGDETRVVARGGETRGVAVEVQQVMAEAEGLMHRMKVGQSWGRGRAKRAFWGRRGHAQGRQGAQSYAQGGILLPL